MSALAGAQTPAPVPVLAALSLRKHFGGVHAVRDVSLSLEAGRILGVIGANGAGKSTLVDLLSGFSIPSAGRVLCDGKDITGRGAGSFARLGVRRTFQSARPFPTLSVGENLCVGISPAQATTALAQGVVQEALRRADLTLTKPAMALTAGQLRLLGVIRAAMGRPRALLLDEPAAGMNLAETASMIALLRSLADAGVAVLIIDHNMDFVFEVASWLVVLDEGQVLVTGQAAEIAANPLVVQAYLGHIGGQGA